jgi:hypothetical protein
VLKSVIEALLKGKSNAVSNAAKAAAVAVAYVAVHQGIAAAAANAVGIFVYVNVNASTDFKRFQNAVLASVLIGFRQRVVGGDWAPDGPHCKCKARPLAGPQCFVRCLLMPLNTLFTPYLSLVCAMLASAFSISIKVRHECPWSRVAVA